MESTIEIQDWEMVGGEGMLVAEGVHDPATFIEACKSYGVEPEDAELVEHVCFVNVGPRHGFDDFHEEVQGEPTHTVLRP